MSNSTYDFTGFLDSLEARNLASIERETTLQLSEMQTRLSVLKNQAEQQGEAFAEVFAALKGIDVAFRDPLGNIVQRLTTVGSRLSDMIIKYGSKIKAVPAIYNQTKGFVRAYLDAVEASRNEDLIDAAYQVGKAFQEIAS